jgi:hypothetical protein
VRRRRPRGAPAGPAAELAAHADRVRAAAARGDPAAIRRLPSVESWLWMLRAAGYDPDVAELLNGFAQDDV